MRKTTSAVLVAHSAWIIGLFSEAAHAYIGPGAGLTAIGTFIALIGGIIFAIVGFVWYPIKRLLKRRDKRKEERVPEKASKAETATPDDSASDYGVASKSGP